MKSMESLQRILEALHAKSTKLHKISQEILAASQMHKYEYCDGNHTTINEDLQKVIIDIIALKQNLSFASTHVPTNAFQEVNDYPFHEKFIETEEKFRLAENDLLLSIRFFESCNHTM